MSLKKSDKSSMSLLTGEFYQMFKSKFSGISKEIKEEQIISNSLCGASNTLIPEPDKDIRRVENCRSVISLVNIDGKTSPNSAT